MHIRISRALLPKLLAKKRHNQPAAKTICQPLNSSYSQAHWKKSKGDAAFFYLFKIRIAQHWLL